MHASIREMYLSGELAAVKFPAKRIGNNVVLQGRLEDLPAE